MTHCLRELAGNAVIPFVTIAAATALLGYDGSRDLFWAGLIVLAVAFGRTAGERARREDDGLDR